MNDCPVFAAECDFCRLHDRFGVFSTRVENGYEYLFRVWAPAADKAYLVGDFVGWDKGRAMTPEPDGVWQCRLQTKERLDTKKYKYKLVSREGVLYCADPFAKASEYGGEGASCVFTTTPDSLEGRFLQKARALRHAPPFASPLAFYEVDLASFCTNGGRRPGEPFASLNYRALAARLTTEVKQLGYTHILLTETVFGSLFAPSGAFGTPEDFKAFVTKLHANGIGVLYPIPLSAGEAAFAPFHMHRADGYRETLTNTLISALLYYTETFRLDGFLFLGEDEKPLASLAADAIAVLQRTHPSLILIAKDLAIPLPDGVYGWDGVRENALDAYLACDPFFRRFHHKTVETLPTALSVLPRQNGRRASQMGAIFGSYEEKFANNRLIAAYRAFLPLFRLDRMGNELALFDLTDGKTELPHFMLNFRMHRLFYRFQCELNAFYLAKKALWETNAEADGCRLLLSDAAQNLVVIERRSQSGASLVGVFNFSGSPLFDLTLPLQSGKYRAVFSTDSEAFGGEGTGGYEAIRATADLAPLSALFIESCE